MRLFSFIIIILFYCILFNSCKQRANKLFTKLSADKTGINFRNLIKEDNQEFNIVMYPYYYNGGGVAVGDINNDGLTDICFTGNMVKNRLYINKGNMQFEDITERAGIAKKEGWCTGVTMVDINGDGNLDIYICRSGLTNMAYRKNLLFINNGDLTFTEKANEYGLDDAGYSTQSSFFDYDKDGDLDIILINQSTPEFSKGKIEYVQMRNQKADSTLCNKLFRNDNGYYINISEAAGITSNPLSFSLGISTADINKDGWPDIYIANDFKEPDYFFINNKNGTFTEQLNKSFAHTSLYAMGIDVADYNNDALPDLIELDMLPEGNHAQKMHMGTDGFDQYNLLFKKGMPYQYMKNSLQKNNGDGTFSEIGQLAGVSNTDWSWSSLLCDFDNDGLKDLFITNGYKRDNTDIQFVKYSMDQSVNMQRGGAAVSLPEYIARMPGIKIENYIYKNSGNDKFVNRIIEWGLDEKTLSHGAAYADLDNDGDLDIITNNTDDYAGIYQNNAAILEKNNYLKIKLQGVKQNSLGFGTKVYVMKSGQTFYQEQTPVRGYCSSVDAVLNFGIGKITDIDSVRIVWNDNSTQVLKAVKANQTLICKQINAATSWDYSDGKVATLLKTDTFGIGFIHTENDFNDFTVQTLLPNYLSRQGPCSAVADINKDGLEDFFLGGAKGQVSKIFMQKANGQFAVSTQTALDREITSEIVAAIFFDADNDGDNDLYAASGGYEFAENDAVLQDRLYMNDGKGNFSKKENALPPMLTSKGCVKAADIDGDGDMDLFVGGRVVPGKYPVTPDSYILVNDGKGNFTNATATVCGALKKTGMVTDAVWADINNDKQPDLIVAGEWMPVKIFLNQKGKLTDASSTYIHFESSGWWNTINASDMDGDGDVDLIIGNCGSNTQFKVSEKEPMQLYYKDFDENGSIDPVLCYYINGVSYPAASRDDLTDQLPLLKKKFLEYKDYANATITDIFSGEELRDANTLKAATMQTLYLENQGTKGFIKHDLPLEAQYAPVYAIITVDVNKDGKKDILLAGNNTWTRIKFGRYSANHGVLLLGAGGGNFKYVPQIKSGLSLRGNVRSLTSINTDKAQKIIVGINDANAVLVSINE